MSFNTFLWGGVTTLLHLRPSMVSTSNSKINSPKGTLMKYVHINIIISCALVNPSLISTSINPSTWLHLYEKTIGEAFQARLNSNHVFAIDPHRSSISILSGGKAEQKVSFYEGYSVKFHLRYPEAKIQDIASIQNFLSEVVDYLNKAHSNSEINELLALHNLKGLKPVLIETYVSQAYKKVPNILGFA